FAAQKAESKQNPVGAVFRDIPNRRPLAAPVQARWRRQEVLVAIVDYRPQLVAVKRDMLSGNDKVRLWPAIDRRADTEAAQHCYAQPEGQITALIEADRVFVVVITGDPAARPFDQPVVADHRGMRQLRAEVDCQLAQRSGLVADPIDVGV